MTSRSRMAARATLLLLLATSLVLLPWSVEAVSAYPGRITAAQLEHMPGWSLLHGRPSVPRAELLAHLERLQDRSKGPSSESGPHRSCVTVTPSADGVPREGKVDLLPRAAVADALVGSDGRIRVVFVDAMPLRAELGLYERELPEEVREEDMAALYELCQDRGYGVCFLGRPRGNTLGIAMSDATDGVERWEVGPVGLAGFDDRAWITVDPSLIALPEGGFRLYFLVVSAQSGRYGGLACADSSDGVNYRYKGIVMPQAPPDTEVFRTRTGFAALLPTRGRLSQVDSQDGFDFQPDTARELWPQDASPARVAELPHGYRMYLDVDFVLHTASSPDGRTWTFDAPHGVGGGGACSTIRRSDGTYLHYGHYGMPREG